MARLKRQALDLPGTGGGRIGERAALEVKFSWGVSLIWIAFQPIVGWRERRIFGYEALVRSEEPLMRNPADILDAAERLGRLHDLGRAVRARVAEAAPQAPDGAKLFVNLHSADLNDAQLYSPDSPLSKIATRVGLEVTDRASLYDVNDVAGAVARLKALGFQVAIDDLGAGYAGLTSFTQLEPEVAKLDMSLVRGIDVDSRRQSIARSMKKLCDELGMLVVAEGVETVAERDTLTGLGCDLLQGYLFARPDRGFQPPRCLETMAGLDADIAEARAPAASVASMVTSSPRKPRIAYVAPAMAKVKPQGRLVRRRNSRRGLCTGASRRSSHECQSLPS
jgi:EAL domain-containing protein (putative c-di-GMP-specific phosphodiesterase class I)